MSTVSLEIIDGPDKPALQWAIAYPERETARFTLADSVIDTTLSRIEERGNGFDFGLVGIVTSGRHKGLPFVGSYSVETRSGTLKLSAQRSGD